MKRIKLADVLWDAANKRLGPHDGSEPPRCEPWSCHATASAEFGIHWREKEWHETAAQQFLRALGCDQRVAAFEEIRDERARIGVRYMWLLLAMHVAEDEGIEVEVER